MTIEEWVERYGGRLLQSKVMQFLRGHAVSITKDNIRQFSEAAIIGLLKAYHLYDPKRGMKPSSYAATYMNWAMLDFNNRRFTDGHHPVFSGGRMPIKVKKLRAAIAEYRNAHDGRYPPPSWYGGLGADVAGKDQHATPTKGLWMQRHTNRVCNLTLLATHGSCDEAIPDTDGHVRVVDTIPADGPSVEDDVEAVLMIEKIAGHLQCRFGGKADEVAGRVLAWLENPRKYGFRRPGNKGRYLLDEYLFVKDVLDDLRQAFA